MDETKIVHYMENRSTGFGDSEEQEKLRIGNTYFFGIGINQYQHFNKLNNAVKDVQDIGNLLTTQFGFIAKKPFYEILVDKAATRRNIIKQLNDLAKTVQPIDRVLIYYSGHGYLDEQLDLSYWIPVNAEKEFIGDYVTNSDVRDIIKAMDCRHVLLISDSCFSGSLLTRAVITRETTNRAFYDWERKASRWVVSSGKGEVPDGKRGGNSPFAKQLLKELADVKTHININSLANEVTTTIQYNYKQQPEASPFFGAGHEGGQFIFYRNGVVPTLAITDNTTTETKDATKSAERATAKPTNTDAVPPSIQKEESSIKTPKNLAALKVQLRTLVEKAELEMALTLFKAHLRKNASIGNDITLLTSRLNATNKDINRGIITNENARMSLARINYALTTYIDDLTAEEVHFPN